MSSRRFIEQIQHQSAPEICSNPMYQICNGIGSIDDHNSFTCQVRSKDDKALLEQDKLDKGFEPELGK